MTYNNILNQSKLASFVRQSILILSLTVIVSGSSLAAPQDESSLKELKEKWSQIDAKLVAKEDQLKAGDGDIKTTREEFKALVDEANDLISQIEETAKTSLTADPKNQETVRTLMGIMLNDAQLNRDDKVLRMGDLLIANGVNPEYFTIASRSERLTIPSRELFDELLIRHAEAMKADLPRVKFQTTQGDIVIELFENEAPDTVGNFVSLVDSGFYSDVIFHRVVEGFMAQGGGFKMEGDKEVGGEGPGYEIKCECDSPEKRLHFTGSISMAHRGKDTGGSQFFLTFSRTNFLDGRHTCFGRIVEGMDVLENLTRTHIGQERSASGQEEPIPDVTKDKIIKAEVIRKRDHEYRPDKVGGEPEPKAEDKKPEVKKAEETKPEEKKPEDKPEEKLPEEKAPEASASDEKANDAGDTGTESEAASEEKAEEKKTEAEPATEKKDDDS